MSFLVHQGQKIMNLFKYHLPVVEKSFQRKEMQWLLA
jgi:hypothetical protein